MSFVCVAATVLTVLAASARWARRPGAAPPTHGNSGRRRRGTARRDVASGSDDLAGALITVAARLRAGATPALAWATVLGRGAGPGDGPVGRRSSAVPVDGVPDVEQLVAAFPGARRRRGRRGHVPARQRERARAVVAASQVAASVGAPLATVLEGIAETVALDQESEDELRAAFAGPRTTARVIAWLPALGLGVGVLLGADPVREVLGGGLGTTAAVGGLVLILLGRAWTGALLRRAERAAW